jgi:hypothetical protein
MAREDPPCKSDHPILIAISLFPAITTHGCSWDPQQDLQSRSLDLPDGTAMAEACGRRTPGPRRSLRMRVRGLRILRHRKDQAKAADQRVLCDPAFDQATLLQPARDSLCSSVATAKSVGLVTSCPGPSGVSTADAPTQSRTLGRLRHFTKIRPPARSHGVDPRPVKKILCN